MSQFLHNEICPRCRERGQDRSGNNLGVWGDHKRCWACGYYEPGDKDLEYIKRKAIPPLELNNNNNDFLDFPTDCNTHLRLDALEWLRKYGIRDYEIEDSLISFSYERELLLFPIMDRDFNLLMWQGRYFGKNKEHPKYLTKGNKDSIHILGGDPLQRLTTIVLVEDLISAIKVSRRLPCMPIFGSHISRRLLDRLKFLGYTQMLIWLDPDKAKEAMKFKKQAEFYFNHTAVILSNADPKEHSDVEIEKYISESLRRV